ncbi:hypothetical protein EG835_12720 [bacterium]|nr:hypothetical protein [bacterium]
MNTRPFDTSESAWKKVREIHVRLGPEGRVEAAFAASELIREAALAGLRMRHPGWDERHLHAALLERFYGSDLAARALAARSGVP